MNTAHIGISASNSHSIRPGNWLRRIDDWFSTPLSAQRIVIYLALYLVFAANWPLWFQLQRIGSTPGVFVRTAVVLGLLNACALVAILAFTAWTRYMKPLWLAVVLVAALSQYYMLNYSVVMDPGMMGNVLQTDAHEVADLLGWHLFVALALVMVIPLWWLVRVRIPAMSPLRQMLRNVLLIVASLGIAAVIVATMSRDLGPLMRNHPQLRYLLNPIASLYSSSAVVIRPLFTHTKKLISMGGGAALGASYAAQTKPLLFVLVVGETGRADHFGLNGYARNTTPQLATRNVFNWTNVRSCGTSTLASVPCMFSPLGKKDFESRKDDYETLLDVAQAAGLGVLWIDNQSGCKGVCDRVPHVSASTDLTASQRKQLCDASGECRDMAMLENLQQRLDAIPAEKRSKGILLVFHQMGSHGPAYSKRSSLESKRFTPECKTEVLADCAHSELMNAYDNSIVETDRFLGATIDWLKTASSRYDTGMLYLSDHGESLGEYGQFLHGLPYSMAPDVQKHVPMVSWLSPSFAGREQLSVGCLRGTADAPYTHDNLYHSMLGLLDVRSPSYQSGMDLFAKCKGAA
ncbi:phosphoethanolamine transferase [Diaphorobacter aerolatus]|uniref:Phosphoethanolamine--lipid A transferase n=1 Tax=Diaphorobacter aerolatus TaxID=1288495 RepID=A0A7H0GKN6_9BURK|nr:phosphoethanolamine--lipid A transferase [Diaphorobacter aerolatus]QNP48852.1 phosphoethanolamine--lipid A transferase [Diaphorobacter aerolatus]